MTRRESVELWSLLLVTLATLVTVTVLAWWPVAIDCNDPSVWSTESGVSECAINGGK